MKKRKISEVIDKIFNVGIVVSVIIFIYVAFIEYRADGKAIEPYAREEDYPVFSGKNVYEYWRSTLSKDEQAVYDDLKEGHLQFRKSISLRIDTLNDETMKKIYDAFLQDHPEIFWKGRYQTAGKIFDKEQIDTKKTLRADYLYTQEEAISLKEKMQQNYEPIIEEAQKQETELDKIQYVHDALIQLGNYQKYEKEQVDEYQSIVSIFRDGNTVCSGYSLGFKMIMDRLGIESTVARDISNEDVSKNHIWNLVHYDGTWYNIDITWDADNLQNEKDPYKYFMKSHETFYKTHKKPEGLPENPEP